MSVEEENTTKVEVIEPTTELNTENVAENDSNDVDYVFEDDTQAEQEEEDIREAHKRVLAEKLELERKVAEYAPKPDPITEKPKPTLESVEYDAEKFEQAYAEWHEHQLKLKEQTEKQTQVQKKQQETWQSKVDAYVEGRKAFADQREYQIAEATVQNTLNTQQQSLLVQSADKSAKLVFALAKSPNKLKELAAIVDPIQFAVAVAKMEFNLKNQGKTVPAPERIVRGASKSSEKELERLRKDAEKSGDYSKVLQWRTANKKR